MLNREQMEEKKGRIKSLFKMLLLEMKKWKKIIDKSGYIQIKIANYMSFETVFADGA
jgi:hypothetical protein